MKNLEQLQKEVQTTISSAIDADIPKIYFNGVINNLSNTDVLIVLQRNQKPVAVLNASFSTIKGLAHLLGDLIAQLENITGEKIMTGDFIAEKMLNSAKERSSKQQ